VVGIGTGRRGPPIHISGYATDRVQLPIFLFLTSPYFLCSHIVSVAACPYVLVILHLN